jgi:hypothetical protein
MGARVMAAWRWLPVIVRAPIVAFVVLNIGTTAGVIPLFANMKFHPEVPWAFPATLIVMAVFWHYFTGGGYPAATRAVRQDVTRLKSATRSAMPSCNPHTYFRSLLSYGPPWWQGLSGKAAVRRHSERNSG